MGGLRIFGYIIGWLYTIVYILVAILYGLGLSSIETSQDNSGEITSSEHSVAAISIFLVLPTIVGIASVYMLYGIWKNQHKFMIFWLIAVPIHQAIHYIMIIVIRTNIFSVYDIVNSVIVAAIVYYIYRLYKQIRDTADNKGSINSEHVQSL